MDPLVPTYTNYLFSIGPILTQIGIIILLIFFSAFFSAAETALSNCNRVRIKVNAEAGKHGSKMALRFIEKFDNSIITILIGNNIVNITASAIATVLAIDLFADIGIATVVSTIVMTILIFLFGEIIPKNIAKANSDRVLIIFSYPLFIINIILKPIELIFSFFIFLVKKIFRVRATESLMNEDDFQDFVDDIEELGVLNEEESDIIQAAVDFGDITIQSVLTPVDKIVALNIDNTNRKSIIDFLINTEYSRVPVYSGDIDNIIGILHVRTFLKRAMTTKHFVLRSLLKEAVIIPPALELSEMVEMFKTQKMHMAIVKDNEKTIGLVTMEDVLEELVGELSTSNQAMGETNAG